MSGSDESRYSEAAMEAAPARPDAPPGYSAPEGSPHTGAGRAAAQRGMAPRSATGSDGEVPVAIPLTADDLPPFVERRRAWGRRKTDNIRRWVSVGVVLLTLSFSVFVLRYISLVLAPFAAAVLLAYLLNPVANSLNQKMQRRSLAVALTVLILLLVAGPLTWQGAPAAYHQTKNFMDDMNNAWNSVHASLAIKDFNRQFFPTNVTDQRSESGLQEFLQVWKDYITHKDVSQEQAIAEIREQTDGTYIGAFFDETIMFVQNRSVTGMIHRALEKVLFNGSTALAYLVLAVSIGGVLIIAMLYLVLALSDYPEARAVMQSFLPQDYRSMMVHVAQEFHVAMQQYFVRQAVSAILTAGLFILGFTFVGLPMAVPMGVGIGLLSMVPYLQLAGLAPTLALAMIHAVQARVALTPMVVGIIVVFVVIQLIQELIFKPYIVGRGKGIERMGILLSAFLFPVLIGPLGAFLAIPISCAVIAWYRVRARGLMYADQLQAGDQPTGDSFDEIREPAVVLQPVTV